MGTRTHRHLSRQLTTGLILFLSTSCAAQLISDPFEEVGDETYFGGFGSFNWVTAAGFGFTDHAGAEGFLSNYTGTPLLNLGMEKPLGGSIANTTYRVSFYYTRYLSPNAVPYSDYNYLYIGSPNGTMIWDTVPTPVADGVWVKWSGTFTPQPGDIGQAFRFGFSMTLYSGVSLAMDGPVIIEDLSTGLSEDASPPALEVLFLPGMSYLNVRCDAPMVEMTVHDAQGRQVNVDADRGQHEWRLDVAPLPPGHYLLQCRIIDGTVRSGRFVVL